MLSKTSIRPLHTKATSLDAIVANDRNVVLDVWITIERLVSPAENKNSGQEKDDHGESESDAQCCKARRFNHSYQGRTIRYHPDKVIDVFNRLLRRICGIFRCR